MHRIGGFLMFVSLCTLLVLQNGPVVAVARQQLQREAPMDPPAPQQVRIPEGSSVILRANAEDATGYLWFRDGQPLEEQRDPRLKVSEAGVYTVIALGAGCDSELSAPVEVLFSNEPTAPETVDMQIFNESDQRRVLVGGTFTYEILIRNVSEHAASDVRTVIDLPDAVRFLETLGTYEGHVSFDPNAHQVEWHYGTMPPLGTASLRIQVLAERDGDALQLARVSSLEADRFPRDNEAATSVEIVTLKIPNLFTPNGDGLNDYFVIRGIELYPRNRLLIFNRWGHEIYRKENYANDWDGGGTLRQGTYFYQLEIQFPDGQWKSFRGPVALVLDVH